MTPLRALEEPDGETLRVQVLKVFDGDGFLSRVALPHRGRIFEVVVRCGFIDAPELAQPGGHEAREFLSDQIADQTIDLALLMKMDTGGMIDRYKRIVAVPYLNRASGSRNIELELILNGWAWLIDRYCPPKHYYHALEDAQQHRRGIWARDDNVEPWEFKKQSYRSGRKTQGSANQRDLFSDS